MPNMKGTVGQTYLARSGTSYIPDASGNLINVAGADVADLERAGCVFANTSQAQATDGLYAAPVRLLEFKNTDGSALAAAASAGKFGVASTLGTSFALVSEGALSNTKTDDAIIEYVLPANFVKGTSPTVIVNASTAGAGTLTTKTAQIKAYRIGPDGTSSADLGPGVASAITPAGADIPFLINGATLNPGDRLLLELETVLTETSGVSTTAKINSVRMT